MSTSPISNSRDPLLGPQNILENAGYREFPTPHFPTHYLMNAHAQSQTFPLPKPFLMWSIDQGKFQFSLASSILDPNLKVTFLKTVIAVAHHFSNETKPKIQINDGALIDSIVKGAEFPCREFEDQEIISTHFTGLVRDFLLYRSLLSELKFGTREEIDVYNQPTPGIPKQKLKDEKELQEIFLTNFLRGKLKPPHFDSLGDTFLKAAFRDPKERLSFVFYDLYKKALKHYWSLELEKVKGHLADYKQKMNENLPKYKSPILDNPTIAKLLKSSETNVSNSSAQQTQTFGALVRYKTISTTETKTEPDYEKAGLILKSYEAFRLWFSQEKDTFATTYYSSEQLENIRNHIKALSEYIHPNNNLSASESKRTEPSVREASEDRYKTTETEVLIDKEIDSILKTHGEVRRKFLEEVSSVKSRFLTEEAITAYFTQDCQIPDKRFAKFKKAILEILLEGKTPVWERRHGKREPAQGKSKTGCEKQQSDFEKWVEEVIDQGAHLNRITEQQSRALADRFGKPSSDLLFPKRDQHILAQQIIDIHKQLGQSTSSIDLGFSNDETVGFQFSISDDRRELVRGKQIDIRGKKVGDIEFSLLVAEIIPLKRAR